MLQLDLVLQDAILRPDQLLVTDVQPYVVEVKPLPSKDEIMLTQVKNEHENVKLASFINLKM